jgi:hypothetical protein
MKKIFISQLLPVIGSAILLVALVISFLQTSCTREQAPSDTAAAEIAKKERTFQSVFNTLFTRDSIFETAFNQAFTQAYGADSLQNFQKDRGLTTVQVTGIYNLSGVRKGRFIVPAGSTLHNTGILIGRIQIDGGRVQNEGVIVGNVTNEGGEFQDNGLLQGALLMKKAR